MGQLIAAAKRLCLRKPEYIRNATIQEQASYALFEIQLYQERDKSVTSGLRES